MYAAVLIVEFLQLGLCRGDGVQGEATPADPAPVPGHGRCSQWGWPRKSSTYLRGLSHSFMDD